MTNDPDSDETRLQHSMDILHEGQGTLHMRMKLTFTQYEAVQKRIKK